MHHTITKWLGATMLVALGVAAPAQASTLQIVNDSGYGIFYLYMPSSGGSPLGSELLGPARVIRAGGGVFTVTDIACGARDIWLVDQDGDVCLRPAVYFCDEDTVWHLTSDWLVACEQATTAAVRSVLGHR